MKRKVVVNVKLFYGTTEIKAEDSNVYEADFIQELLRKKEKKLEVSFNFNIRYKDDVFSLNNSKFCDYVGSSNPWNLR